MKNRVFSYTLMILCFLLILSTISSCANLPQKIESIPEKESNNENPNIADGNQQEENTETDLIRNYFSSEWTEPAAGPTVTPIVLGIELRGEEGGMIIRTSIPEINTPISFEQYSPAISTVPPVITGPTGMYDEMALVNYNPVNGATVLPGQAIHLDVTLKNNGTTTWQTSYKVVDDSASPMAVTTQYNLPYAVAPGGNVILSIYMAAPAALGTYRENFHIQDAYGAIFGQFEYVLTVGDFSYVTEIPTLTATITPTYYSAEGITATPDSLAWMCIDPERSKLQDCYSFCSEYSDREEFHDCFYDGIRYETPIPDYFGG